MRTGRQHMAKFYRPGRWSYDAIAEEHRLVSECAALDLPVVAPVADGDGETVHVVSAVTDEAEQEFLFAVYPKRSGRNFDGDRDEDWLRIGALVGRLHVAAAAGSAGHRLTCTPQASTVLFVNELAEADLVPADAAPESSSW